MWRTLSLGLLASLLLSGGAAQGDDGNWLKLERRQQQGALQLERQQRGGPGLPAAPDDLANQQQLQQRSLHEQQRRTLSQQRQQLRTRPDDPLPSATRQRLNQQQFDRQQQHQLNRFRIQQQGRRY